MTPRLRNGFQALLDCPVLKCCVGIYRDENVRIWHGVEYERMRSAFSLVMLAYPADLKSTWPDSRPMALQGGVVSLRAVVYHADQLRRPTLIGQGVQATVEQPGILVVCRHGDRNVQPVQLPARTGEDTTAGVSNQDRIQLTALKPTLGASQTARISDCQPRCQVSQPERKRLDRRRPRACLRLNLISGI